LKAKGYKIFVDTAVPADHLTTMAINRNTHKLYQKMKRQQFDALNRALGEQRESEKVTRTIQSNEELSKEKECGIRSS